MCFTTFLPSPEDTDSFAALLANRLGAGDVLLLEGEIGAGKSHLSRAIIRHLTHPDEEVPSPTFTLVQTYDALSFEIWHCDLYRLSDVTEVDDLGLFDAFDTALCLVEWPDRLGEEAPQSALSIRLESPSDGEGRTLSLSYSDTSWSERLAGLYV